jgi:hypothetical protein
MALSVTNLRELLHTSRIYTLGVIKIQLFDQRARQVWNQVWKTFVFRGQSTLRNLENMKLDVDLLIDRLCIEFQKENFPKIQS